jgi:hypothetical protein
MKIDICFVLDCTASMGPWIAEAKKKTVEMVEDIRKAHEDASVNVAFIGYRDYGDAVKIIDVDFRSPEAAQQAIQRIEAEGGDDDAEDVAMALFTVLHLNWTGDMKFVVHITDAPAHGTQFHTVALSDRFPLGDPEGRDPRDSVEKFSFLNINYTFVKISRDTDMMIREFERCYKQGGTFKVLDLLPQTKKQRRSTGDPENLSFSAEVSRYITTSITQHTISQVL